MPLLFDMPREQLDSYQGTNPKPADFEDYWKRALTELDRTDPGVKLLPSDFKTPAADCRDLFFTGVGGARIYAKLLRPRRPRDGHPATLLFHGYSGHSGEWMDKLGYAALGYTVAALDCRGQGGRSEDAGGVSGNTLNGHIFRFMQGL